MSGPVVVRAKSSEIDENFPRRSSRARVNRAVVIEGEAPETDDEFTADTPSTSAKAAPAEPHENVATPQRARVHVDEKLEQRWRKLGEDVLTAAVRRVQPTMKMVNDMETCLDNTLAAVQGASGHIRHASTVVYHLEDSVGALLDAAKLIPTSFENTVSVMRLA
ncbi:hypothetical protein TELCIR_02679 [Teladorsagia circumcincta]|uniref:Biogenesis of lysosome-related organelles complex 1 subunit 3 n=1 Tax=Teladorsagia circumcincta TaxID=45464 RepID=A0A2G9UYK8_TELCI|nr:hypothetical protein TELCIR_02679 [Teladorsagia circumcincta]